jgi:thiol:disulfide interchange protein DsbA
MKHLLTRRTVLAAAVAALACAAVPLIGRSQGRTQSSAPAKGAGSAEFRSVEPPQPVETGNKIEVLEFFWYGCPHCYSFMPELEAWRAKLPSDVEYRRLPVAFDASRMPHTKIFYALEQLKRLDLHEKVFSAIHVSKRNLLKDNEIADLMAANGIDRAQWLSVFNSFSVVTKASRSNQVWAAYRVDGTPMVAVDGKYLTAPSMVGSTGGSIAVLDKLVQRARAERKK